MILTTYADSIRQWGKLSGPKFFQVLYCMLTTLEVVQHILAPSYVSFDANSRESKCNLVPLVGADTNSLGQECSGV